MKILQRGFTLIESLTVIAVLVVIIAIAAPNLRTFVVRNKVAGMSNEFSAALTQARSLAVSRNGCVSLCVASSSNATDCLGTSGAAGDYQANGWVMFQNAACSATAASGVTLQQRTGESNGYSLKPTAAGLNVVMFDPRGYANLTAAGTFEIAPPGTIDNNYKRRVCLDAAGRPTVRHYSSTC